MWPHLGWRSIDSTVMVCSCSHATSRLCSTTEAEMEVVTARSGYRSRRNVADRNVVRTCRMWRSDDSRRAQSSCEWLRSIGWPRQRPVTISAKVRRTRGE